ncbi:MAG: TIGR04133 family radical SAM/SPASM protein [Bacteroidales bacterium]|nr:TIGR04133 family radical SAM/SPASM protein [Bacteroidales bacterium]MBN2820598.1 TIGR04133 family radical SAM/SPASM protein [Bacteroidales bacterium]
MSLKKEIQKRLFSQFAKNETAIHELRYLFWECTLRCNLNCLHCGSDCTSSSSVADMPADVFLKQAEKISKTMNASVITVVITGGEPLLRKDLEQIGLALRKMGFRWSLVTNGLAYTVDRHLSLMGAGMGALTLSFDGLEDEHNWLRNSKQSFEKAQRALEVLISTPRLNFDVVTCVNPRNIDKLEEIYTFFLEKGLQAWRLFTIAPIGRAKDNSELLLNREQFTFLMEFIKKKKHEKEMYINFSCEAYVAAYETEVRDGFFFCRAGIHIGSILIDGGVSACPNIDRGFVQGNIYENDFSDIWNSKFQVMRDRSWTRTGSCANCKEYKWCKGSGMHLWKKESMELIQCHASSVFT